MGKRATDVDCMLCKLGGVARPHMLHHCLNMQQVVIPLARRLWGIDGGAALLNLFDNRVVPQESQWHFDFVRGAECKAVNDVLEVLKDWDRFRAIALRELFGDADVVVLPVTMTGEALPPDQCGNFEEVV